MIKPLVNSFIVKGRWANGKPRVLRVVVPFKLMSNDWNSVASGQDTYTERDLLQWGSFWDKMPDLLNVFKDMFQRGDNLMFFKSSLSAEGVNYLWNNGDGQENDRYLDSFYPSSSGFAVLSFSSSYLDG